MPRLRSESTCDLPRWASGTHVLLQLHEFLINTPKILFSYFIILQLARYLFIKGAKEGYLFWTDADK